VASDYNIIRGNFGYDGGSVFFVSSDHNVIENNTIKGGFDRGIYLSGDDNTLRNNDISGTIVIDDIDDSGNDNLYADLEYFTTTIDNPDGVGDSNYLLFHVVSEKFPNGITLSDIGINIGSVGSYSAAFQAWDNPVDVSPSSIETLSISGGTQAEDNSVASPSVIAGAIIVVVLPATDINQLNIWFTYHINDGN